MKHISWKYDKLPHMLISGDTGSGKTIFLLIVIKALLESGAVLHICDPKKADLSYLSRIMPDVNYDTENMMGCVEAFYEGMEARYDEMQEHPDFRMGANYAKVGLTPHFLIFDEYVAFMDTLAKKEWERGYEADPDYYHERQTGRIFYYSCVSASGCKISRRWCPRSVRFPCCAG